MNRPRRIFLHLTVAVAAFIAHGCPTLAQTWPTRPLTLVEPFGAGGTANVLARILAPRLSELLGQPVIVENVSGAGGMTGVNRVAKSPPDGYQFVIGGAATHAFNQSLYKSPLYNAATDFAPVALLSEQPLVLVTRKDFPAGDLREFISYAKANQGKMQYASGAGTGSANHLSCLLLNSVTGIDVAHVPYRSTGGLAMQDMIAGRIDYQCTIVSANAVPLIERHQIKAIATLTKNRAPLLPDVPTAHEQGLTDFEAYTWYAFFLPRRTPSPIVQKLHGAIVAAMDSPAVQARMKEFGAEMVGPDRRSPEYLQGFVEREIRKWAAVIKGAGVSAD
jgi:tripartite-type tricarboxylate transporter receptor subunit TctC